MPARRRVVELAAARGREAVLEIGRELDMAIQNLGLSYAAVGRDVGLSGPQVARVAHGQAPALTIVQASELMASVGLDLSIRSYPTGRPLRDSIQTTLLERFHARLHSSLGWRTEVPVGPAGDLRAWDAVITGEHWRMAVEAETRLRDWQALERRLALKLRDSTVDGILLVVWDTKGNRAALRALGAATHGTFPVAGKRALELLAAGANPGGSSLIVL
jgi:hypothetical protein